MRLGMYLDKQESDHIICKTFSWITPNNFFANDLETRSGYGINQKISDDAVSECRMHELEVPLKRTFQQESKTKMNMENWFKTKLK